MSENPGQVYPVVSSSATSQVPTEEDAARQQAWASFYSTPQQQSTWINQFYPTQINTTTACYYPYTVGQDYYNTATTVAGHQSATPANQDYQSYYQYGYQQGFQSSAYAYTLPKKTEDPLPPGNEEVEIPGLGMKTTQMEMPKHEDFVPPLPAEEPPATAGTTMSHQDMFQQSLQQAQLIAQNARSSQIKKQDPNSIAPTVTPGFQFRPNGKLDDAKTMMAKSSNLNDGVPFLIKPAIPRKPKQQSAAPQIQPSYIVVKAQKQAQSPSSRVHPFTDKIEHLFEKTPLIGQDLEPESSGSSLNQRKTSGKTGSTLFESTIQRKRRKFDNSPKKIPGLDSPDEELRKQERSLRFSKSTPTISSLSLKTDSKGKEKLVGTCEELEKSYFRLSCRPDPSVVRPEPVLEQALDRLVHLIQTQSVDYFYIADQFKGMRQDCTVQQLQSGICARIYEASARAHLEYGEIWEYNQCQSNLETLYKQGVPGSRSEFLAYRILYQLLHIKKGEAILLNKTLRSLSEEDRQEARVKHALKMVSAFMTNNLRELFRLYLRTPNLGRALLDHVLEEIRYKAAKFFIKSIRLKEPVECMIEELGFYSDELLGGDDGLGSVIAPGCMYAVYHGKAEIKTDKEIACKNCAEWLKAHGAILIEDESKGVRGTLIDPIESRNKLFIPKAENAVAHGDPNLSMSYFLVK